MVTELKNLIEGKIEHLRKLMESDTHIHRQEYVIDFIYDTEKYFSSMDSRDREYLAIARAATENGWTWTTKEKQRVVLEEDDGYTD
jgi:hypothetical protein